MKVLILFLVFFLALAVAKESKSDSNCLKLTHDENLFTSEFATIRRAGTADLIAAEGVSNKALRFEIPPQMPYADFVLRLDGAQASAAARDLSAHSMFSFSVYKISQPARVAVIIETEEGSFKTLPASLYDALSTISVDLAGNDFAPLDGDHDSAIAGLDRVRSIAIRFMVDDERRAPAVALLERVDLCAATAVAAAQPKLEAEAHAEAAKSAASDLAKTVRDVKIEHKKKRSETAKRELSIEAQIQQNKEDIAALNTVVEEFLATVSQTLEPFAALAQVIQETAVHSANTADTLDKVRSHLHGRVSSHAKRISSIKRHIDHLEEAVFGASDTNADDAAATHDTEHASMMGARSIVVENAEEAKLSEGQAAIRVEPVQDLFYLRSQPAKRSAISSTSANKVPLH